MGGEDFDPDKNVSEGYYDYRPTEPSKTGAILSILWTIAKIKEPILFPHIWLVESVIGESTKKKKKRRKKKKKILGE